MPEYDPLDPTVWEPHPYALSVVRRPDPGGDGPTIVSLRHPTVPFLFLLSRGDGFELALRHKTLEYLQAANSRADLELPAPWLDCLSAALVPDAPVPNGLRVGWLPLRNKGTEDAFSSVCFERESATGLIDRTIVVAAVEQVATITLGSEVGLRVSAQVRRLTDTTEEIRITSMSASIPVAATSCAPQARQFEAENLAPFLKMLSQQSKGIAELLNLQPDSVQIRAIIPRFVDGELATIGLRAVGLRKIAGSPCAEATYYDFHFLSFTNLVESIGERPPYLLRREALVTGADCGGAAGQARVFPRTPPTQVPLPDELVPARPHTLRERRPTRGKGTLDGYRECEQIVPGHHDPLKVPDELKVMCTRFVRDDLPLLETVKRVHLPAPASHAVPPVYSDDFSAVNGFRNPRDLFDRLRLYGIDPACYFFLADLPVEVHYRSGVRPGPGKDGQTVNAAVKPVGWARDQMIPLPTQTVPPKLQLHLALANLSKRARAPWNRTKRSSAEPLGIAADERWIWHELGHVVLMATTGELEMRFAHSPGDALAAIIGDPCSNLAAEPAARRWRGATFPWVYIPRRHDRCVTRGWSWSGQLHRSLRELPDVEKIRRKGYWSEQILSSSLFRLYQCLGGDTALRAGGGAEPDLAARSSASHYAVYLILRAFAILDDARIVPASDPDQFVCALIDADIGTESFTIDVPNGAGGTRTVTRIGGTAHKAIRWAFEAQGLYATPPRDAPGDPPVVDIYISDNRPLEQTSVDGCRVVYGAGSYVPVSLEVPLGGDGQPLPDWFTGESAIAVSNNTINVVVGNRGSNSTSGPVTTTVWWAEWPHNAMPPDWDPGSAVWTRSSSAVPTHQIPAAATRQFGPFQWAPEAGKRYVVLAAADCDADRANSNPATGFACSQRAMALSELIPNDNNLAVRLIEVGA